MNTAISCLVLAMPATGNLALKIKHVGNIPTPGCAGCLFVDNLEKEKVK
jgi:hypothetical protein